MQDQHIYHKDIEDLTNILINGIERIAFQASMSNNRDDLLGITNTLLEELREYRSSLNNL